MNKKDISKKKSYRILVMIIAVIIVTVFALSIKEIIKLHIENHELKLEQETMKNEKKILETELKNVNNPAYIEQQARKLLRMVKPGEVLFVIDEDKNNEDVKPDNTDKSH